MTSTLPTTAVEAFKIRHIPLQGWQEQIAGRWSYRQLAADPAWRHGWISFDALAWEPLTGKMLCGINSIEGDIFYTFDPRSGRFQELDIRGWADAFDVKVHRTILPDPASGWVYFGTSLLHDAEDQHAAPGGKLVRYHPIENRFELLGIPFPHLYLQSIAADFQRGIVYAFTYPAEFVVRYDLATGKSRPLAYVGNAISFAQPHNAVVDRQGRLWGTYAETRAWDEKVGQQPIRLFSYDPDQDRFQWFEHGLSRKSDTHQIAADLPNPGGITFAADQTRHAHDYGVCDSMAYDGQRYIYAGTVAGVLCRVDTTDGSVQKISHLIPSGRMPGLKFHRNGTLYAAGGLKGHTRLACYDPRTQRVTDLGQPRIPSEPDPALASPARIHEIDFDDQNRLYLAENDNHGRSSFLWRTGPL